MINFERMAEMEEVKNAPETEEAKAFDESCDVEESKKAKKEKKNEKKDLAAEVARLESELAEQADKYLRMAAEYDNFRRRSREEKEGVYDGALSDTVSELLPIIDNLDRAALYDDGEKIKEGLVMIAKSVEQVFAKLRVEAFGAPGETFDPNIHNAVLHIDDDSYGEGEIVEVFQKGYKKGNHIIRFAMVKTAN